MTDNHCEICGLEDKWNNTVDITGLHAVTLFTTDEQGHEECELLTSCRLCLVKFSAYKVTKINETGASQSGWMIDDHEVSLNWFSKPVTASFLVKWERGELI